MNTNGCQPPNCPCFCPTADIPIAPIVVAQGGPAVVVTLPIYGTQPFQVSITVNPILPITGVPVIASVQVFNGNVLTITTAIPDIAETLGIYVATIQVCNACGSFTTQVQVEVAADLNPVLTNCVLAQALWTPEARVPTVGDTLLAFTPAGCRALLPPLSACAELLANPTVAPALADTVFGQQGGACVEFTASALLALYPLCTTLQALPAAAPLAPADRFIVLQGATCATTTLALLTDAVEANIDICVLLQNLPNAVVQPTAVFYGQQGGACFEFAVADLGAAIFAAPVLAANGSCAAPSYSFAASPDSGMFYDPSGLGSVVIGDDNCADFISVGASVSLNAATSFVILRGGYLAPGSNCGLIVETNNVERLRIGSQGAWNLGGGGGGSIGQVVTSNGSGAPPTWQTPAPAVVAFPLLAPDGTCLAPSYSFAASPDSGVFYDSSGSGTVIIGDDNCADFISVGASVTILSATGNVTVTAGSAFQATAATVVSLSATGVGGFVNLSAVDSVSFNTGGFLRFLIQSGGAWSIGASVGTAGQVIKSNGVGVPPTWQNDSASFPLLAPNGSCVAPSYSFTSSPDSGMFYTGTAVRIGDDNCADFIEVGASINVVSATSAINATAGTNGTGTGASLNLAAGTAAPLGGNGVLTGGSAGTSTGGVVRAQGAPATGVGGEAIIEGGFGPVQFGAIRLRSGGGSAIDQLVVDAFSVSFPSNAVSFTAIAAFSAGLSIAANNGLKLTGQASGAGAGAGTLSNAPSAGDPAFWLPVTINGVNRFIPCWA